MTVCACHSCNTGPGPACFKCKRVEYDDIRISHSPHNRDELQATMQQAASEKATSLPDETEDALRRFLATATGLDVVSFVAALHYMRRGGRRRLAGIIRRFAADVREYNGAKLSRATVFAKWRAITEKIPELAAVRSWTQGHGGRETAEDAE